MILVKFFRCALLLSKLTYQQKSVRTNQTFLFYSLYMNLTYKCQKCELFECLANAISLRAGFKPI